MPGQASLAEKFLIITDELVTTRRDFLKRRVSAVAAFAGVFSWWHHLFPSVPPAELLFGVNCVRRVCSSLCSGRNTE